MSTAILLAEGLRSGIELIKHMFFNPHTNRSLRHFQTTFVNQVFRLVNDATLFAAKRFATNVGSRIRIVNDVSPDCICMDRP